MKITQTVVALALLSSALILAPVAHAAPSGPSAKAAARLKKNPTSAWLAHYLPDDRYKIAGKVWKYVSTNLDTYYHRPDSPNMMRQPNSNVIGFASAEAAEEAGYKPDPRDGTLQRVQREAEQKMSAEEEETSSNASGPKRSGRVYLADGKSIITIPAGWQRLVSQAKQEGQSGFSIDLIMHPATGNMAAVMTMNFPGIDVGRELSGNNVANRLKQFGTMANSNGQISNAGGSNVGDWATKARVRRTKWGGLTGIAVSPPSDIQAKTGVKMGNMIMVGRGSKAYMLQIMNKGKSAPNTSAMIKSFRPG